MKADFALAEQHEDIAGVEVCSTIRKCMKIYHYVHSILPYMLALLLNLE